MKQAWARPGRLASVACLVVAAGAIGVPAADADERFCDTAGHPQETSIDGIADAGIAEGGTDGCFRPDAPVTRGQVATFLQRAYGLAEGRGTFCDTAGHSHESGIRAAAAAGIAEGRADGCYRPDASVTRGQMATFLARAEQLPARTGGGFCDTAGHAHEGSIGAVVEAGIAQGYDDGCFRPDTAVTRAQMAAFLVGVLPGAAAQTSTAPAAASLSAADEYEARLFSAVNVERTSRGLPALSRDGCADRPARSHAQRMAGEDRMYHQDLGPVLVECGARRVAENVGHGSVSAEQLVRLWMGSAPHRAAILDPRFTAVGSGAGQLSAAHWYASLVFLQR